MKEIKNFMMEEDGIGVVEIVLILIVLVGLVVLFKNEITSIMKSIMDKVTKSADQL